MKHVKFAWFRKIAVVSILVVFLFLPDIRGTVVYAQAGQITLKPTDDTYVDSNNPNSNYGGQTNLDIEYVLTGTFPFQIDYIDIVWLKFDLSSIPNAAAVDMATVQLYAWLVGETYEIHAHSCSDNSWTELTLSYSNMPGYNITSMDSATVLTSDQFYDWNVIDAVTTALNSKSTAITIVLSEPSPHSSFNSVLFYSKEEPIYFTDYSPNLTVHWTNVVPEFPTFAILPFAMLTTLIAVTLYRRRQQK